MDIHQDYITNLIERQELIVNDHTYSQQEKLTAIIRLLINDIADKGPSARVFSREVRHLGPQNMKIIKRSEERRVGKECRIWMRAEYDRGKERNEEKVRIVKR